MKHLKLIAERVVNQESKDYDFIKNNKSAWVDDYIQHMEDVRKALITGKYYTCVDTVSQSGMSRVIKIKYIKNNKLHNVPNFIYKLAGCDKNRRISGCGMDMLFAAQYNLFVTLCPKLPYQTKMKRYNDL